MADVYTNSSFTLNRRVYRIMAKHLYYLLKDKEETA